MASSSGGNRKRGREDDDDAGEQHPGPRQPQPTTPPMSQPGRDIRIVGLAGEICRVRYAFGGTGIYQLVADAMGVLNVDSFSLLHEDGSLVDPRAYISQDKQCFTLMRHDAAVTAAIRDVRSTLVRYQNLPVEVQSHKAVASEALRLGYGHYRLLPEDLRRDVSMIRLAVQFDPWCLEYMPRECQTAEIVSSCVGRWSAGLAYVRADLVTPQLRQLAETRNEAWEATQGRNPFNIPAATDTGGRFPEETRSELLGPVGG